MAPTPYYVGSGGIAIGGGGGGGVDTATITTTSVEEPLSRTYQYRKVMKPMLERKRRARINRCLDELKELMVTALQNEGENVSKLEKADILELTVRHLHNLKRQHQLVLPSQEQSYADRFRAGFNQCAQEVTHFITTPSSMSAAAASIEFNDPSAGRKLLQHLGTCVRKLDNVAQNIIIQHQHHQQQQKQQQQQHQNRKHSISLAKNLQQYAENEQISGSGGGGPMWRPW